MCLYIKTWEYNLLRAYYVWNNFITIGVIQWLTVPVVQSLGGEKKHNPYWNWIIKLLVKAYIEVFLNKVFFYHLYQSELVIVDGPIFQHRIDLISFLYAVSDTVQLSYL